MKIKSMLASIVIFGLAGLFFANPTFASHRQIHQTTIVDGTITNSNGQPLKNAQITASCNSSVKTTRTNRNGSYQVTFSGKYCDDGDTVIVNAVNGNVQGSSTGVVGNGGTCGRATINFAVVNFSIPEFGAIEGSVAFILSLGSYLTLRKRNG